MISAAGPHVALGPIDAPSGYLEALRSRREPDLIACGNLDGFSRGLDVAEQQEL